MDTPRPRGRQHHLGNQATSRASVVHRFPHIFGPQGTREHCQGWRTQCSRPALARVPFGLQLHTEVPQRYGQRQRRLHFTPTTTSHRRRPHRTQPPHWPQHCWHLPHSPLRLRTERAAYTGYRLGWAHFPPSRPIPTIQPLPFTADDYRDFRLLGSRMEHHGIPNNFVGHISTCDSTARPLVSPENAAVNTGAPPGSASWPPVVSPLSTIGTTEPPPLGLISSRARHRAAAAAGTPRPSADYGLGRRPKPTVSRRPASTRRPPTPPARAQPRLPPTRTPPAAAPTPPASPAPTPPRPAPPSTSSPTSPSIPTFPLPDPVVDFNNDPHLLARVERNTHRDWAREQRAEPGVLRPHPLPIVGPPFSAAG